MNPWINDIINNWAAGPYDIKPRNYGLYQGKTGDAIVNGILKKATGNADYGLILRQLLDEIGTNIGYINEINYKSGLTGIGWAIEWMVENNLFEADTNEVLEEVDNLLYKAVLYAADEDLSLANGTLGKVAYFLKRYQRETDPMRLVCHEECLVILTDEIRSKAAKETYRPSSLKDLSLILILLDKILPHRINMVAVEEVLYNTAAAADQILSQACANTSLLDIPPSHYQDLLHLAYAYFVTGIRQDMNHWKHRGEQFLNSLLNNNINILRNKQPAIQGAALHALIYIQTGNEKYREYIHQIITPINLQQLPPDLYNGQGAVLLAAIALDHPEICSWEELLLF